MKKQTKQDKTMVQKQNYDLQINKTMKTMAMVAKPYLAKSWHETWTVREVRILQRLWLNLETKYCGEVIGDEVQLWNGKQVTWVKLSDRGKNMTEINQDLKT